MFSKILKEKRKDLGLTQQEVADKLNVSRQTISNWEVGKSYPDTPTLIEISNFYNLSLDYMLKGDLNFMKKIEKDTKQLDRYKTFMKTIKLKRLSENFSESLFYYSINIKAII